MVISASGHSLIRSVDNPVAQKLLIKQLERFDLNVIATSNGEEAITGTCSGCAPAPVAYFTLQSGKLAGQDSSA